MDDMKRGDDAADHTEQPKQSAEKNSPDLCGQQDAPNYRKTTDKGQAIEREDVNSANDE